jgi:hypothetical protein
MKATKYFGKSIYHQVKPMKFHRIYLEGSGGNGNLGWLFGGLSKLGI